MLRLKNRLSIRSRHLCSMLYALCSLCVLFAQSAHAATVTITKNNRVGNATTAQKTITPGATISSSAAGARAASTPAAARAAAPSPVRVTGVGTSAVSTGAADARRSSVYNYIRNNATAGISVGGTAPGTGVGGGDVDLTGYVKWVELLAELEKIQPHPGGHYELTDEIIEEVMNSLDIKIDDLVGMIAGKQNELIEGAGIRIDNANHTIAVRAGSGLIIDNDGTVALDMDAIPVSESLVPGQGIGISNDVISVKIGDGLKIEDNQIAVDRSLLGETVPCPEGQLRVGADECVSIVY
ncbi:MAG: hypothetical protein FWG39_02195 [Alphaproteobacteria bacterium]|nr:hypothetical protein [Alphaproteobacteria bacterium]